MRYQNIPVNHQVQDTSISRKQDSSASSVKQSQKQKSLKALSLIASISSLGITVSFSQVAAAKTTIFNGNGETTIVKLPSLQSATEVSTQANFVAPTTSFNLDKKFSHQQISQIPSLVDRVRQKAALKKVHTVKPGDTVSSIARIYGIPSNQIIDANKLTNPNFIKIDRKLVIPNIELAREYNYQKITTTQERPEISSTKTKVFSIGDTIIASEPEPSPSFSSLVEKKAESRSKKTHQETIVETSTEKEQLTAAETKEKDPYISKLRQDIIKLRTKYQQQNGGIETATTVTPTNSANSISPIKRPETNISKNTPATRVSETAPINRRESLENTNNNSPSQPQSVVSKTNPVTDFKALISLSTTNTAIPDLPPLASPEEYLPDNPIFDGYLWPAKGTLTSGYGWRWGRMHKGIDIAAPIGTPIMAAASGEVIFAGWNTGGYGNLVKLRHRDGSVTFYAHNNRVVVNNGQRVRQGQLIAEMGSTGRSTGPHLHFEIRPNGSTAINPIARLPRQR